MRRQIVVRNMPPGAVTEASLAALWDAALRALPSFDASAGAACAHVQLYAGGTYAFIAMRDFAVAATATALPTLQLDGASLLVSRVRGYEGSDADSALSIPPELDLSALTPPLELGMCHDAAPDGGARASSAGGGAGGARMTLEERLFWSLRRHPAHPKPAEKEVKEAFAFFKKSEKLLGKRTLIIDCCGSHGLIGAVFAAFGKCRRSVVLDLHRPNSFDQLMAAWAPWLTLPVDAAAAPPGTVDEPATTDGSMAAPAATGGSDEAPDGSRYTADGVHFVRGDLADWLPALLDGSGLPASEMAVVACHACSWLTDTIIGMCIARGVDFAVLPCCHKDLHTSHQMGVVAKSLQISEHAAIDVARLGSIVSRGYDCRWRTIDPKITPQNRMMIGLARIKPSVALMRQQNVATSGAKMVQIYTRVHDGAKADVV